MSTSSTPKASPKSSEGSDSPEPSGSSQPLKPSGGTLEAVGHASVIGLHMVSALAVGTFLGYLLDDTLDTFPWCSGIGLCFGIAAGFRAVWLDAKRLIRHTEGT